MRRAAIVTPVRTPVGTFGGSLRPVPVEELAATTVRAVVQRSGIDPARIDDVVFAQSYANGEAPCIGRWAALQAGLPIAVPGMQLDRRCGGGLQAIVDGRDDGADRRRRRGDRRRRREHEQHRVLHDRHALGRAFGHRALVRPAGPRPRALAAGRALRQDLRDDRDRREPGARLRHHPRRGRRLRAAQPPARRGRLGRRASSTTKSCPCRCRSARAIRFCSARTRAFRADTTPESLAKLRALMKDGTVTAGNASQQNDAAAACLVVAEDKLAELGLTPMATLVGWAAAGCEPSHMGIGPVPAVKKLFARTGPRARRRSTWSSSTRPSPARCWPC